MSNYKKYKKIKDEFLGMDYGSARQKLVKNLLFTFAKRLSMDICYRCNKPIDNIDDFSIDHKKSWLHNSPDLFFDVDNVSFSHCSCNYGASAETRKKIGPEGTSWCSGCQDFLDIKEFSICRNRWNGLDLYCKPCKRKQSKKAKAKAKAKRNEIV